MSWRSLVSVWSDVVEHLCRDFPLLEREVLVRMSGDHTKLQAYLAAMHDLTEREAEEALSDWVFSAWDRIEGKLAA